MDLHKQTNINIQEKSNLIWAIADKIREYYKPHEYGKVILPMTVIKRFNDILAPTKDKVLEVYEKVKGFEVKDPFLETASGYKFYNSSKYDFQKLLNDSENIEANFREYLNSFSENVQDILANFDFDREISKLANSDMLYLIIEEFNKPSSYLGADKITAVDMGYIFEDLVRRFSESYDEQAGAHFTSRDIIYLMTDILIAEDRELLIKGSIGKTVYDMTMGTSQMLTCMSERLKELDKDADIKVFGQELNPETYAIAKADMLIRGGDSNNMKQGNTLSDDKFKDFQFDYIISNPPFGIEWKVEKKAVEDEAKQGDLGRFGVGLPKISDGQMLFDLNGISKLKDTGRMAIIHNGSSLFTGAAGSGESEIRRYMLENDWLEAIIQLPNDSFYNTGITTYIWIISKNKPEARQGKVQLINASAMCEARRKNIGNKRVDITEKYREIVVQAYGEFKNKTYEIDGKTCESKIFDNVDFGFNRIQIESPLYDENGNVVMKGKKIAPDTSKRDYENVPLVEDIDSYFEREVKPYNPEAWIDKTKTKVGYEIPFTRYFYKYEAPESSDVIAERISIHEKDIMEALNRLFSKEKN
ncbi:class I SAM-dependent DNA methyltransferase [uncultured Fusobacterium sp.]|uniref:type I restriction-modification system subunit M n=1 Tax=uncultured Fusobacterium sp. TaxID=159267 RepID=UPI00265D9A80|nr:class I SAM-dependent DNA methyltransferase [uncultured Fusobacterium sp.]